MLKYDLIALHMHHGCVKKKKLKEWLCEIEMRMKILQRGQKWKEKKIKKWNDPREGKLRREWDPYGEIPKSLPREDSKWGVHLGTNAYPSMKAWEWQCIVWLCDCMLAFASWLHLEEWFVLFIKCMFEYIIQD